MADLQDSTKGKDLTNDDIVKILKFVEESHFDLLQLEYEDLKITASKRGSIPEHSILIQPGPAGVPSVAALEDEAKKVSIKNAEAVRIKDAEAFRDSGKETAIAKDMSDEMKGLVPITAPMVGVFYSAPEPGAKPFVSVGSVVDKDTIVGLIEVMKVFSGVFAGVKGTIIKCLVENGQLVEYGQELFLVRSEGTE